MNRVSNVIGKVEKVIYNFERLFTALLLCTISVLVFLSAVMRKIGVPINWAQDFSLLCFAWLTFIGGDLLMRTSRLISIDMVTKLLPKFIQKWLTVVFDILMMCFLLVLIKYGFPLVNQSWNRLFNTLNLSYAWCTLCVPVGSILMMETLLHNTIDDLLKKSSDWGEK